VRTTLVGIAVAESPQSRTRVASGATPGTSNPALPSASIVTSCRTAITPAILESAGEGARIASDEERVDEGALRGRSNLLKRTSRASAPVSGRR
jgi:hypothetical protein